MREKLKYLKYLFISLAGLVVVAAGIHLYRESIARSIANTTLNEYGFTATELAIETLGPDQLELSRLVLEQDNGTLYRITGLSMPINFSANPVKNISIEHLLVSSRTSTAVTMPLSELLQTVLHLPALVPDIEVSVSTFSGPEISGISNLVWQCAGQRQHLAFRIDTIDIAVDLQPLQPDNFRAMIKATGGDSIPVLTSELTVHRAGDAFTIQGHTAADMSGWFSALTAIGVFPQELASLSGELSGNTVIVVGKDSAQAKALLNGTLTADYLYSGGSALKFHLRSEGQSNIRIDYPGLNWAAETAPLDILASKGANPPIPIHVSHIKCHSDRHCVANMGVDSGPFSSAGLSFGNANLSTTVSLEEGKNLDVKFSSGSVLRVAGLKSAQWSFPAMAAIHFNRAQFSVGDSGTIFATDFMLQEETVVRTADDTRISIPSLTGTLSLKNQVIKALLGPAAPNSGVRGTIEATHNLLTDEGSLSAHDVSFSFDAGNLSRYVLAPACPWDVVGGTLEMDLRLDWTDIGDQAEYHGTFTADSKELAGHYQDIAFTGLSNQLVMVMDTASGTTVLPSSIEVGLLDVGLPLEEISADISVNLPEQSLQVGKLSLSAMGGRLTADPFIFSLRNPRNSVVLRPHAIQLQFMVDLAEFEDIKLSGNISGKLPISISSNSITITGGRLASDPPGGVINYLPGIDTAATEVSDSSIHLVSRALANFHFDSLTSDVDYTATGDLTLKMKLTGVNPDMDDKQPVILNLGVENNIPQLLRSLRAVRSIEDILDKRFVK